MNGKTLQLYIEDYKINFYFHYYNNYFASNITQDNFKHTFIIHDDDGLLEYDNIPNVNVRRKSRKYKKLLHDHSRNKKALKNIINRFFKDVERYNDDEYLNDEYLII